MLEDGHPVSRVDFCRFVLHADADNPIFLKKIDERKFDQESITDYRNTKFWAPTEGKIYPKKELTSSQRYFLVNVWMGVISNNLISP